jgi:hypothetical protein
MNYMEKDSKSQEAFNAITRHTIFRLEQRIAALQDSLSEGVDWESAFGVRRNALFREVMRAYRRKLRLARNASDVLALQEAFKAYTRQAWKVGNS